MALVAVLLLATTVGPTSDTSINDLYVYSVVHDLVVHAHQWPYRDFTFEYPPLALGPIVAAGGSAFWLGTLMLACLLAAQEACRALAGPRAAWLLALSPLLLGAMVRTHFDALPAALAVAALVALERDRPRLAFALLGVGTMTKLWPLVLAPVALAWLWRRGDRAGALGGLGVLLAVCAVLTLPLALSGGLDDTIRFHLDRPVQIESGAATVLFAAGGSHVTGDPVAPDRFKSNGLDGGHAGPVLALFTFLELLVLMAAAWLAWRGADLVVASTIAVLAFVALGKVLSPQYLVWLAPFAAVLGARAGPGTRSVRLGALLIALGAVATQLEFPSRYFALVHADAGPVVIVGVRNALLVAAALTLGAAAARSTRPSAASPRSAPARP